MSTMINELKAKRDSMRNQLKTPIKDEITIALEQEEEEKEIRDLQIEISMLQEDIEKSVI
jgi:hypothetical protein